MKHVLVVFWFSVAIFEGLCERRYLRIENCTADPGVARIELCDIIDGKYNFVAEILEPQDDFFVSLAGFFVLKFSGKLD